MLAELYRMRKMMADEPALLQESVHQQLTRECAEQAVLQLTEGAIIIHRPDILLSLTVEGVFVVTQSDQKYLPWENVRENSLSGWVEPELLTDAVGALQHLQNELHERMVIESDGVAELVFETTKQSHGHFTDEQPLLNEHGSIVFGKGEGLPADHFVTQRSIFEQLEVPGDWRSNAAKRAVGTLCRRIHVATNIGLYDGLLVFISRDELMEILGLEDSFIEGILGDRFSKAMGILPAFREAIRKILVA